MSNIPRHDPPEWELFRNESIVEQARRRRIEKAFHNADSTRKDGDALWWPEMRRVNQVVPAETVNPDTFDTFNYRYQLFARTPPTQCQPRSLSEVTDEPPPIQYNVKRVALDKLPSRGFWDCSAHWDRKLRTKDTEGNTQSTNNSSKIYDQTHNNSNMVQTITDDDIEPIVWGNTERLVNTKYIACMSSFYNNPIIDQFIDINNEHQETSCEDLKNLQLHHLENSDNRLEKVLANTINSLVFCYNNNSSCTAKSFAYSTVKCYNAHNLSQTRSVDDFRCRQSPLCPASERGCVKLSPSCGGSRTQKFNRIYQPKFLNSPIEKQLSQKPEYGTYKIIASQQYHIPPSALCVRDCPLPPDLNEYREFTRRNPKPKYGRYDRTDPANVMLLPANICTLKMKTTITPHHYCRDPRAGKLQPLLKKNNSTSLEWQLPSSIRKQISN